MIKREWSLLRSAGTADDLQLQDRLHNYLNAGAKPAPDFWVAFYFSAQEQTLQQSMA